MWLCLKMGSGNMVLRRLLQIGAMDLIVIRGRTDSSVTRQGGVEHVCSLGRQLGTVLGLHSVPGRAWGKTDLRLI